MSQLIALRMPDELLAWVDRRGESEGLNRSQMIIWLLRGEMGDGSAKEVDGKAAGRVRAVVQKKQAVGKENSAAAKKGKVGELQGGDFGAASPDTSQIGKREKCGICGGTVEAFYAKFKCTDCGHIYLPGE
jgi:rubredoxin